MSASYQLTRVGYIFPVSYTQIQWVKQRIKINSSQIVSSSFPHCSSILDPIFSLVVPLVHLVHHLAKGYPSLLHHLPLHVDFTLPIVLFLRPPPPWHRILQGHQLPNPPSSWSMEVTHSILRVMTYSPCPSNSFSRHT